MTRRRPRDYTSAARAAEPVTERLRRTFGWAIVKRAKAMLAYGSLDDAVEEPGLEYNPRNWDYDALQETCRQLKAQETQLIP